MKRWLFAAVLFLGANARASQVVIDKFGGLNVDDSPATLENGQTPDSENILTDYGPGFRPRQGITVLSTTTCINLWEFPKANGDRFLICQDAVTYALKASLDGQTFNRNVSTITVASNVTTVATTLGDKFFWSNTSDGLKSWDGTNTTLVGSTLAFNQLITHKARVWGSGVPSAVRTIYGSEFGDGTRWTLVTDPVDTDPTQIVVGGALDEPLTALYASFQNKLIWMKAHSMGAITGNDRSQFEQIVYWDKVGTSYPESIKDCDGVLRWQGPARTVWEFDGAGFTKISKGIDGILAQVTQGDASARTFTFTSQTDFDGGTNYQTGNHITAGDVMLATFTATDSTAAEFGAGTAVNVSSTAMDGSVILSTNANPMNGNESFESGSGATADEWTDTGSSFIIGRSASETTPQDGSYVFAWNSDVGSVCGSNQTSQGARISVRDPLDVELSSNDIPLTTSWSQFSILLSGLRGRNIKIVLKNHHGGVGAAPCGPSGFFDVAETPVFFCNGGTLTGYAKAYGTSNFKMAWDAFGGTVKSTLLTGSLVSQTFNTAVSSPAWLATNAAWTSNNHTVLLQTQASADGVSWDGLVTWSTGSAPVSAGKQYIRYKINFSTTNAGGDLPYVDDVTLSARSSSGTYISNSVSLGNIGGWGPFAASGELNDGTLTYAIYTDTDAVKTVVGGVPVLSSYVSSQTITSNAIPTLSTMPYAFIGEIFRVTSATQNPTNHSLTLNWNEGSSLRLAGVYTNQRYWLGVAINSSSNNRVLVYDRNKQWQRYSGINMTVANIYNSALVFSNSTGTWQGETGTSDNGTAIEAYYTTPTLSPAGPNLVSVFTDFTVTSDNSDETLVTTFQGDGIDTDYSLGSYMMNATGGIQNKRLPFPSSQRQQGNNISLKLSVSGTSFWRILGATLDFMPKRVPY